METERNFFSTNNIYGRSMKRLNSAGVIRREDILNNFSPETIANVWETFCKYVNKNYQSGKGTTIPKFGVFTFNSAEVNLEGATNQNSRDLRLRKPVFIVSSDFVEKLKPGIYTPNNGIVYYNQKKIDSMAHVKINYSEMAFSQNMKKEDFQTILDHMMKFIGESIKRGEFKNKDMPGLGVLQARNNILAVKFNENFAESMKSIPQKLKTTKKHVNLYMEVNQKDELNSESIKELPNVAKTLEKLRPKTAVLTKITLGGEKWLKENYDIDLAQIEETEKFAGENINPEENKISQHFINDIKPKTQRKPMKLEDLKIANNILEAIYFHKGVLLSEMKNQDRTNSGIIKKFEFLSAFTRANVHSQLSSQTVNDIVNLYSSQTSENINYSKVMGILLKEIQTFLNFSNEMKNTLNKYNDKNFYNSSSHRASLNGAESLSQLGTVFNRKAELEEVYKEIKSIKIIYNKIKSKYSTSLTQKISYSELANIFREFSIIFPREKLLKILNFIEINDIASFSLAEFTKKLDNCKILATEMTSEEIINSFNKLKNIVYTLGGRNYLFSEGKATVNKQRFINLFKAKTHFSEDILEAIFNYLTKTDRELGLDDYTKHFEEVKNNQLNEAFEMKAIGVINNKIHKTNFLYDEYFNQLLSHKKNRSENYLNIIDFHNAMLSEKFKFTAEELDFLFKVFDTKKDSKIDRDEFKSVLTKVNKPLFKIQDIIKKNNLEIEDLMYKMNIDLEPNKNEKFDFFKFKAKMKLLDSTFDHDFIRSLFDEMKTGVGESAYVDRNSLLMHFNVFKKEHFRNINNDSFRQNFIQNIKQNSSYRELKEFCEKIDKFNSGLLSKVEFCGVIQKITGEYKDEDIMRFIRISSLFDDNRVKYPQFLDLIFYIDKEDKFMECADSLVKFFSDECGKDIYVLFSKILGIEYNKPVGNVYMGTKSNQFITIDKMLDFIRKRLKVEVTKNIVCKLDLDLDGKISIEDMKGILSRYGDTSYFKYENSDKQLEVNIYPSDVMDEPKFKQIVGDIKAAMKFKNITEIGLFNKLDANRDGFVSHPEFCKYIDDVIQLAPSIKDQFFNHLDIRSLGMVDLDTFLKRFKEFKSNDVVVKNNWEMEQKVIFEFAKWIKRNIKFTADELYAVLDFDCDGTINLNDFKLFLIDKLNFSKNDLNDFKIERAMQQISLTKNNNLGIADIKEFINYSKVNGNFGKESRIFSASSNLNDLKKDQDWIYEAIERLGLYVSENYDSISLFFDENSTKNTGKMRLDDFKKFLGNHYKCFEGFNLTSDEVVTVYTALDPHKKNYLALEDLQNKLSSFDFYKKMHINVKNFIKENFINGIEAFKYFKKENIENPTGDLNSNTLLTKKELFDGLNYLFPKKYQTNAILRYLSKKFKNSETVNFSEFNFIFFEEVKRNEEVFNTSLNSKYRIKSSKLRQRIGTFRGNKNENSGNGFFDGQTKGNLSMPHSTRAKSAYSTMNKSNSKLALATPFDEDPLEKIRRIIHSSRFDFTNFFKMYELVSDNGCMNQFEFRNMIKKLNIGLTSLEIDKIIAKSGKTREGKINLKDFVKFISAEDPNMVQFRKNLAQLLSEIKQMIYKYYTNAKLAFQFNDKSISKTMDFTKFKQILTDLYERESRTCPNFALMKNAFEYVDLRKDGLIDMNEWLKAFSMTESSLDAKNGLDSNVMKNLRDWENSRDISSLYLTISKNKKLIKEKTKGMLIKQGLNYMIHAENLISTLKDIFYNVRISNTQWKMIISITDREKNALIDFDLFFNLIDKSVKQQLSHPKIK